MITSTANEKVKFVKKLHDKKNRDAENLFIAEGVNILSDLKEGFSVKEIFATDKTADIAENLAKKYGACLTLVSESVMKVLADTVSPSGILAVIGIPLSKPEVKNAVVLDGVQDSGNVGTIIRTAVGAGFSDVYLVDSADAFSPKTVRASMGAVLRANVIKARAEELEDYLAGYDKVAMDMGGDDVFSYRPERKVAVIVGNEAHGLSDFARKFSDVTLSIPMQGGQESLNVAVAAGIAMYVINHNSNI